MILPAMCAPLGAILAIDVAKTKATPQRTNSLPFWKDMGRLILETDGTSLDTEKTKQSYFSDHNTQ
jgi:hypothetical protein